MQTKPPAPQGAAAANAPPAPSLTAAAEALLRKLAAHPAYDVYARHTRRLCLTAHCAPEQFTRALPAREALCLAKQLARWLRRHRSAQHWQLTIIDERTGACRKQIVHLPQPPGVQAPRQPFGWLRRAARHSSVFVRGGLRERNLPSLPRRGAAPGDAS